MNEKLEMRKALPRHKTATSDKDWDGPKNEANLKTDQDQEYYARAYAWRNPEKDPANKTSYKLIHHEVSAEGTPGAANIRGCQSAIGVLNGARGGADIPDADRQGVWNHLAGHLKDADVEPAPLRFLSGEIERRAFPVIELRVTKEDGKSPKIKGHAAVFDRLSEDLGGFREKINPGAFLKTIERDDIRALFNHDPNYVLGRNRAKTLALAEDDKGLAIEIDPPETSYARDLMVSIERGDISQMSFAFQVADAKDEEWDNSDPKKVIRTLKQVKLFDVSPVTYPAYPQTDVKVRSALAAAGIDFQKLTVAIEKAYRQEMLKEEDRQIIDITMTILRGYLGGEEAPGSGGAGGETDRRVRWLKKTRRYLDIAELT